MAFREVPLLVPLIDELRATHPALVPDVVMVDGNGTLHPRGFGVACHLGVVADIPAIGVAKTLLSCNGIPPERDVRKALAALPQVTPRAVHTAARRGTRCTQEPH